MAICASPSEDATSSPKSCLCAAARTYASAAELEHEWWTGDDEWDAGGSETVSVLVLQFHGPKV